MKKKVKVSSLSKEEEEMILSFRERKALQEQREAPIKSGILTADLYYGGIIGRYLSEAEKDEDIAQMISSYELIAKVGSKLLCCKDVYGQLVWRLQKQDKTQTSFHDNLATKWLKDIQDLPQKGKK